jgi:hypothetical protein
MGNSVCYKCPKRNPPNCHSTCKDYFDEQEANKAKREFEHKQRVYDREAEEVLMRKKR